MRVLFGLVLLAGCATRYSDGSAVPHDFSLLVRAQVAVPVACAVEADSFIADLTISSDDTTCPLVVERSAQGEFLIDGTCPTTSGGMRELTLTVRAAGGVQPVVSEMRASVDFSEVSLPLVLIDFNPARTPLLPPKTFAVETETPQERSKFNCDRIGTNTCTKTEQAIDSTDPDADTCSNFQELCAGTLFKDQVDTCKN